MSIEVKAPGDFGKTFGKVSLKVKGEVSLDGNPTRYRHWGLQLALEKNEKIYDVHIKFSPKPTIKVVNGLLNPSGPTDNKINLSSDFPSGWDGSYDPTTGEVTIQAPYADPTQPNLGLDPNSPLRGGGGGTSFDFSFDFEPATAKPGEPPPATATTTVSFSNANNAAIGQGTGSL